MTSLPASGLVLASTSPYRRELLARLGVPFDTARPEVDELARDGESPATLAARLAEEKALAVSARRPGAWVIGSDQVADLDGHALGKPGARDAAIAQLTAMAGRTTRFHTAVALARDGVVEGSALDTTRVTLRALDADAIARYVDAETPFDCAGSFKAEGLGISLFASLSTEDPTALVGLPLIATSALLRDAGFNVP